MTPSRGAASGPPPRGRSERAWLRYAQIRPRRRFSQNFLINPRVRERLVERLDLDPGDAVLEIGAGSGALTLAMAPRVKRVWAVERDPRLAELLRLRMRIEQPEARVKIIEGDILDLDPEPLRQAAKGGLALVGNLPYAITSPILLWILEHRRAWRTAVVMVQKEYGRRLLAETGQRTGSSLGVWIAFHARVELEMRVTSGAFWPEPGVESWVLRLDFRDEPPCSLADPDWLERSLRVVFGRRRRQLAGCVAGALAIPRAEAEALLRELGIDPRRRGESLSLDEHCRLASEIGPRLARGG
ncbi:MAG: ribosomal RNA small subunit methyltransferase A [Candidatus Eisenbacteria bacterium]|nr:ribosomal RNA small subunit methyltransferase A [Candidatus Eisenbacteria bacterium]